ncbi:Brassinosteroid-responsive RING protein 1, partial [Cucurbita argyrosperma subsp. sororia]
MGFPVSYTEELFPSILLLLLTVHDVLTHLVVSCFRLLWLPPFLRRESTPPEIQFPLNPPPSAVILREFLPVVKLSDLSDPPENCVVCFYEFDGAEEIRLLMNCKHIFHRRCVERWINHNHDTCPLCRTPFVPDGMVDELNQRLSAACGTAELAAAFNSVSG